MVDYAASDSKESTTIYVFRAPYPDPGLWFERAVSTVARGVPLDIFEEGPTQPLTAFGATAPNGFQKIYSTEQPGPFKSTAITVARAGEWLVKMRVTSPTLDRAGLAKRIATFADAIRFPSGIAFTTPAALPQACPAALPILSGAVMSADPDGIALGVGAGLHVMARGRKSFAENGGAWCRSDAVPADFGTLLRRTDDPGGWVMLLGDAGRSLTALSAAELDLPGDRTAILFAQSPAYTKGAGVFSDVPAPMLAITVAAPVLAGKSPGLFEVEVTQAQE